MSISPHVMSQADAALSRVIAETSTTPAAGQYWQQKRPLFRQLAIRVVQAMAEGLSKDQAVARSVTELRSEVLQRAATDSARQAYGQWFDRRAGFLSGVAKRLWERTAQTTASPQKQPDAAVRSYKAEMFVHGGWSANQHRYATPDEADAAGKDLHSRWTAVEDYRVVPSSDPPNVEPVINVKPAAETARSDSRIVVMHVADEPKPAQLSSGELLERFHSESRILASRLFVNRDNPGGYPEQLALNVEDLGKRLVEQVPGSAKTVQAITAAVEEASDAIDLQRHWTKVELLFDDLLHDVAVSQARLLAKRAAEKSQATVTEQRVLRYILTINGLWGRKRTPDFHSVTLADRVDPKEPWPLDKLLTTMRNTVVELRVKPGATLKLLERDVTITPDGFERITLLTDRTLHTETLG